MVVGRSSNRGVGRGFTLVELLVVIVIISILVGLILPALQGVREVARRLTCSNNLYQCARACLDHESAQGFYPTGGWYYRWAGDPNQGFTKMQPGGWCYNILPYIDQKALHDMGRGNLGVDSGSDTIRRQLGAQMAATPVVMFCCPSRRKAIAYKYIAPGGGSWDFHNITDPALIARTDYAANAGDYDGDDSGQGPEGSYTEGQDINYSWTGQVAAANETGVIYRRSMVQASQLRHGASSTYLIGEKYVDSYSYDQYDIAGLTEQSEYGDEQGWVDGYNNDTTRWTGVAGQVDALTIPLRDMWGNYDNNQFGSVHPNTFSMAMCDGSVHQISYSVDPNVHRILGNRNDMTRFDLTVIK